MVLWSLAGKGSASFTCLLSAGLFPSILHLPYRRRKLKGTTQKHKIIDPALFRLLTFYSLGTPSKIIRAGCLYWQKLSTPRPTGTTHVRSPINRCANFWSRRAEINSSLNDCLSEGQCYTPPSSNALHAQWRKGSPISATGRLLPHEPLVVANVDLRWKLSQYLKQLSPLH